MKALIVEDEPFIASLVGRLLAKRGVLGTVARSRAQAFVELAAGASRFSFAFVDLILPDGSGLDVVAELRRGGAAVPTILATGSIEDVVAEGCTLLRKPFTLTQFAEAIDACLATAAVP